MRASRDARAANLRGYFLLADMADPVVAIENLATEEELSRYSKFAGASHGFVCPCPLLLSKLPVFWASLGFSPSGVRTSSERLVAVDASKARLATPSTTGSSDGDIAIVARLTDT